MSRGRVLLLERGLGLALIVLVAYVALAATHVVDGDNAEFASLGRLGGAAHPPGYPVYVLWLRALSWLPGVSPAHTSSLATAILGGLGAWVLYLACVAWGARPIAAAGAVAIYAAGPAIVRVSTEAEVFALDQLVAAAILWLAAAGGPVRGAKRAALLGLVAGLGLANHLTCALLAPIGLVGIVRAVREGGAKAAAAGLVGLVAGLVPYLYLLIAPDTEASWGSVRDVGALWRHLMRADYGGPGAFSANDNTIAATDQLAALASTLARAWIVVPLVIGVAAIGVGSARPAWLGATGERRFEPRAGWIALAASFVLVGPLLATRFDIAPEGLGLYVVRRFHLLAIAVLAPGVACGLDALWSRFGSRATVRARAGWTFVYIGFVALVAVGAPRVLALHTPAVEYSVRGLLRSMPPDAVVISSADDIAFAGIYEQAALGERPDVTLITWPMMRLGWYRARARTRGIAIEEGETGAPPGWNPTSVRLAERLLAAGRPVFVDQYQSNILKQLPSYPYGIVFRVLPRGAAKPPIAEVFATNKQLFEGFDLDYPFPGTDDELATHTHGVYAQCWDIIARALAAAGDRDGARQASEIAAGIGPQ